jgi:hypothetical protein
VVRSGRLPENVHFRNKFYVIQLRKLFSNKYMW